jgi:hypothetical protein
VVSREVLDVNEILEEIANGELLEEEVEEEGGQTRSERQVPPTFPHSFYSHSFQVPPRADCRPISEQQQVSSHHGA